MYKRRLYALVICCTAAVAVCVLRLAFLQLVRGQALREEMEGRDICAPEPLPTVRGNILDRTGNKLALDTPVFWLHINYRLTKAGDDRFRRAAVLMAAEEGKTPEEAKRQFDLDNRPHLEALREVISKCAEVMGCPTDSVMERINEINNRMWERREFYAWSDHCRRDSPLNRRYGYVLQSQAREEFAQRFDEDTRLKLASKSDRREMYAPQPLFELNEAQQTGANREFLDIKDIEILPEAKRAYPFGSTACQIIGWVGAVQETDRQLFDDDDYLRYLDNDLCGASGVEWVCEALLRGRRGEITYDRNRHVIDLTPAQFGKDVRLSLDIRLQQQIETFLTDPNQTPPGGKCVAAVVLDVATADILAMVSTPVFDLNTVRTDYDQLAKDTARPLRNKALAEHYPPGSTIKPVLLAIALQENRLSPGEVISCPSHAAPDDWPNCLLFREYSVGHDTKPWPNTARNAIRGSCNVFFSHVADRINPEILQRWLFEFGYGHRILPGPFARPGEESADVQNGLNRFLREATGCVSSIPHGPVMRVEDLPPLRRVERKQFGIGQGNLAATVLQIANAAAVIARDGVFKSPRLFLDDADAANSRQKDLGLSARTLEVVRDGMHAVVTETGGTGYEEFRKSSLNPTDVKVFGKTGSTSSGKPGSPNVRYNAWFMCFAEDSAGRAISLAVVVEDGRSGAREAAPLARRILELCHAAGHIGRKP